MLSRAEYAKGHTMLYLLKKYSAFVFGLARKKSQKISVSFAHAQAQIFDIFFLVNPKTNALW